MPLRAREGKCGRAEQPGRVCASAADRLHAREGKRGRACLAFIHDAPRHFALERAACLGGTHSRCEQDEKVVVVGAGTGSKE